MSPDALFTVVATLVLLAAALGASAVDLRARRDRRREALYLVGRVADRHGLRLQPDPIAIEIPGETTGTVIHFYLHGASETDDSIVLQTPRPDGSRLGNLVVDSDGARIVPGMTRLELGPAFDPYFRVYCQPERADVVTARLAGYPAFADGLRALASRTRSCRVELADLDGRFKVQFLDPRIRFPSVVEGVTLDLLRLLPAYRRLAGDPRWAIG